MRVYSFPWWFFAEQKKLHETYSVGRFDTTEENGKNESEQKY